jgi:hypothetical protein
MSKQRMINELRPEDGCNVTYHKSQAELAK